MNIELNDERINIEIGSTLAQLILTQNVQGAFAIAVNMQFVPQSSYAQTVLIEGDKVELLKPMQGG